HPLAIPHGADTPRVAGHVGDVLANLVVPIVFIAGDAADLGLAPEPVVHRLHGADDLRVVGGKHAEVPEPVDARVDRDVARCGSIRSPIEAAYEAVQLGIEQVAARPLFDPLGGFPVAVGQL